MSVLTNSLEGVRAWWQTATAATRAAATLAALLLVVGLVVAVSLAASPDYTPIYHNVSGKDASAIEGVLRERSIPMVFSDKDGTVSVPSKDESNATMAVEAAGVLSKDTEVSGIESLDKLSMGTSTDVERVHIKAANEGELDRKLMRLAPVQRADVSLPDADDSPYAGAEAQTKNASVILTLRPDETLDADQVKGIVSLVARAVTNLSPKDVTLTDQTGRQLWHDDGLGNNLLGSDQSVDQSEKFAQGKQRKIQDYLDGIVGPHNARVLVSAELNFDQSQIRKVQHDPTPGATTSVPVSSQTDKETYSNGAVPPVGGPAGVGSNLSAPSYAAGGAAGGGGTYKHEKDTTNYTDNVTDTTTTRQPGGVQKMSVTAFVNSSIPAAQVASIQQNLSSYARGLVAGDTIPLVSVQQFPFDTSAEKAAAAQVQSAQSQQLWGSVARALAAVAVAGVLLFMLTRAGRRAPAPQLALAGDGANIGLLDRSGEPGGIDENLLEERPLRIEDVLAEMPEIMPGSRPRRRTHAPAIEEQQDLKLESVQEMISGNPQAVALLLKGWMAEEARVA